MALAALGMPCRISHFSIRRPLVFCVSKVGSSSSSSSGSSTVADGCPTFVESFGSGAHGHSLVADGEYNGKGPQWKKLSSSELGITTSMISRPIRVVLNALKKKASDETDHLARLLKTSAKRPKKHFYLFPRNQSSFFFSSQALSLAEYPTFMGGLQPSSFFDSHSYARCLQNCVQNNDFFSLGPIHGEIVKKGNCLDLFGLNILLNGYVKSRCLSEAYKLFNEMPERNTISFVTLIQGLMQDLMFSDAVDLFVRIHRDGHEMNAFVFTTLLNLLVSVEGADNCDAVHASICKFGLERNAFVGTALIDAYSLCGNVCGAEKVFDVIARKDLVSWTGMLTCLAENGFFEDTIALFSRMRKLEFKPNNYTFASVLKGCIGLEDLKLGRSIQGCILKLQYELDLYVGVGLLELYSKIGSMNDAERVFEEIPNKDVIHWSFMIGRFSQAEESRKAVGLFLDMRRASIVPNQFTFASTLQACAAIECLELGQQLHCLAIMIGLDSEIYVLNALMDVFAKCGRINTASDIFNEAKTRNDVTYNTMIVGYAQMGEGQRALCMFSDMWECQLQASEVTYSGVLHACAGLAALEPGKQIHSLAVKTMYDKVTVVGNSLIDMYAKCGAIKDGRLVFDKMRIKDKVSWNTLISGYSMHGLSWEALKIFKLMEESGCKPNNVTFVGVLSACSNAGLLDQGRAYFESMASEYGIKPSIEHYTCMVWLLGRHGDLDEALKLILEIPYHPSVMVWRALLCACVIHRNVELGKLSAQRVLEIEPQDEAAHVLLSNIYANVRRWDKVAFVRKNMTELGVKKEPGLSWVEYQGAIHCFTVGDSTHPDSKLISGMLEFLNMKTKREGHVFNPSAVLLNVADEEKEHMLWAHSERLALAFGLIRMPRGSPIRIIKNLRICVDCHAAVKMISKLVQREIIIRDMNRFHHFQNGNCSCGDYCLNSFCLLHHAHPHALDQLLINGLSSLGYDVYLVGGCVRDLILKRIPKDFDIITSAELKEVRNTFPRCEVIGRRFPICHVHVNDSIIEVSSFNTSGRNSLWRFSSPIKKPSGCNDRDYVRWRNCLKRDFTINGLMFDPYAKIIYDYIGGMEDLRKAKVRTVIPADLSFVEDCARILRAFRVAARLGFHFTREITFSLRELSHSILTLDKGRILMEMNYMLAFGSGEASLRLLWRFGLLELLLPIQASYFVSRGFKRRDKGSNMLLGLFANLDKVVAPDRPCHSSLWVALLAFHKALVDKPREPTVVAAFALAIYSGGSMTESIKIARGISQQHDSCHLELLESEAPISKLRMMNEVVDLSATVKDVLFNMTNRQYVSQAMKKYPQAPRSDLVFISEALLQRVCNIFECVKRGMGGGSVPARSSIDYNSLTSGRLQEVRHAFARIVFDTVYPVSHQSNAQLIEHHNQKMEELSDSRRDFVVQEVH